MMFTVTHTKVCIKAQKEMTNGNPKKMEPFSDGMTWRSWTAYALQVEWKTFQPWCLVLENIWQVFF